MSCTASPPRVSNGLMTEPEPWSREQLESALLGDAPQLTSDELAAAVGMSVDDARRLWRALGFPDVGDQADLPGNVPVSGCRKAGNLGVVVPCRW